MHTKLRIEGTEREIKTFLKWLEKQEQVEIKSLSKPYPNRNSILSRVYAELEVQEDDNDR